MRVVENKHNCTSLLTVGEMLQQRAWTAQRALPQTGTGHGSFALLRALGGAIMYTLLHKLHTSGTLATALYARQVDVTTDANRQARLRTCRPGRCRLHSISRHHIRQLGILVRRASNRSGGVEEAMPTSLIPRASVSSASKPTTAGPRQGDTSGWKRKRSLPHYLWFQQEEVRSTHGLHTSSTSRRDGSDRDQLVVHTYTRLCGGGRVENVHGVWPLKNWQSG